MKAWIKRIAAAILSDIRAGLASNDHWPDKAEDET